MISEKGIYRRDDLGGLNFDKNNFRKDYLFQARTVVFKTGFSSGR